MALNKAEMGFFYACAGHGMSSVGVKPTMGSYRQV